MRERKTPPSGLIEEISDARVKSARRTSQDTENKPVLPDQPTPTSGNHEQGFLELQKERLLAHEARCQKRSWYPLTDITLGLFRLGVSDPAVRDLATEMKKGNIPDAFRGVLVTNHDGVVCVNLEVLANPGSSEISEIRKIPGAIDLLRVLDRDLTLAGGDSMDSKRFRDGRERTTHTSHQKMLAYMKKEADLMYELVDDTKIPFEDEQQKEDYERIQEKVEEVVKRLFLASGLTHVRPDVHITRSTSMNAFVWGLGREDVAKDIFSSLQSERVVALPIYIHLGLLQRFTTVDELAGVLAHEFSHLLQPEYAHEKDKSQIQRLEYDADKQAMHLADVAGYNPRGLLDAFSYFSQEGFSSFGTETHPDRQYRIIEMEKYFHRSDIPFPNGQKKAESFSPAYRESLGRVSVEKKSGHISFGMESIASALETVRSAPSEDFLHDRSWNEDILKKTGEKFLKDILTDQEFIHDSFGCRTRLVNSLNNFFHLLAIADASASDEHTFKVHLPRLRSHIDKVPSEDLPLSFSHIRDDADRSALVVSQEEVIKKEQELLERCRGLGIQPSVAIESLDDLLDDDHPSAKLFWPHVPNLFGEPLNTRLEKRAYLQQLLSVDINGYGDRINAINISESVIVSRHTVKETKKREPSSSDQKPGVLARAPLAFRAHRRGQQEEPTEEVDVERVQWKQSDHIFSTNGLARGIVSFALLSESPDKQAPAVQEFAQVIEERTVDAFSEFVGEKPSSDVSLFLMQNLVGSQILFQRGEEMSISFVDTARRALEQRLLQNKRSGFIASNKQISLRNQLCTLLAFGLIPQDDHEQAIQTEALLRIQDDPFVVREQPCIVRGIGDELPKGVDAQYVKKSGGDLFLSDRANRFSALGNQMWQTYGEEMEHLLDGGRFIAQIVPPEMRELKIREIDLKHAESKLNEDEARGLFEDTTESAWQERATILARFAAGYRSYMEVMYREVLPTTRDVVAVDTEERKLRKNGRERKFREPYTFLPFLDACVKMLMPYTKKEVSNDQIRGLVMRMFDKAVSPYDANRRLRLVHDLAGIREDETASLFAEYSFDTPFSVTLTFSTICEPII